MNAINITFPYPGYDEVFTSQGSAMLDLQGNLSPGLSFVPVWTTPYNPMTFYVTEALLDGLDLEVPAQVGLFDIDPNTNEEICVGAASLSGTISPQDYLEIIASMNDGTVAGHANGFTPGDEFIFKYITAENLLIQEVSLSFPYTGYDETFTAQGNAIVNLAGISTQTQQQIINLSQGWMGISSYLQTESPDIETFCSGIADELVIIKDLNAFYQPGNPSGTLEVFNFQSGYFIKTNGDTQLVINGDFPENKTVTLTTGWNLMPVLSNQQVQIQDLFEGQNAKILIIKEAIGHKVFWPEKNIESLQNLNPGVAYLIKVNQDFIISF